MVRRLIADDSNGRVTLARSVVIGEEDPLPGTKNELAVTHRKRYVVPCQHGFYVRVGISLLVPEFVVARYELSELSDQISLHIRVCVLVDEHARGRVEHRDDADAAGDLRARHRRAHARGDVGRRDLCLGRDVQGLVVNGHAPTILRP